MKIRRLTQSDEIEVKLLLNSYRLVSQDIDINSQYFLGIEKNNTLIAFGGLEFHHPFALLRSMAVSAKHQGNGYATQICDHLIQQCQKLQISELYLLTENTQSFFKKLGFKPVKRLQTPQSITKTKQFSSLCPDDATVLKKVLLF